MPLDTALVERCAESLLAARRTGQTLPRWSAEQRPQSLVQAYAIQEMVAQRSGIATAGWKLGCTSLEMQKKLGSDGPIAGRVFASHLYPDGAAIQGARPDMQGLEAEFAFCMAHDLPAREVPYSHDEVLAAIGTLHPAIEQVESRFTEGHGLPILDIVADNASHGRLVVGPALANWRNLYLPDCAITLHAGDSLLAQGEGRAVLGDPLTAMLWLANHLSARGLGLRAGEFVTTGTCTGLTPVPSGVRARVSLALHGSVSLVFTEPV